MLDLYRFNMADMEDVRLADRSKSEVYNEGQWLSPVGDAQQTWAMSASATVSADPSTALAKMLFMEKERSDAREVGKMTCVSGAGVRGRTDEFIASEGPSMAIGLPLTLKLDSDGVVKFGLAGASDIVKAFVFLSPGVDAEGLLHFELVR